MRYERQMEDGLQKMVTETYVVDAFTFGEAEEAITKEMTAFVSGEFNVKNITPANYGEIFFSDNANDDKWYKAKLTFITIDEKTSKEKRTNTNYLVQAGSFNAAVKNVEQVMGTTMVDYVIANMSETKSWMCTSIMLRQRMRRSTTSPSMRLPRMPRTRRSKTNTGGQKNEHIE